MSHHDELIKRAVADGWTRGHAKYVVSRPSNTRPEQKVYLSSIGFRDGGDSRRRNWVFSPEHATHYKTRTGAERAAKSWGGAIEEYM